MANNLSTYSDSNLKSTYDQFKAGGGTDDQVYDWATKNNVSADALGRAGADVQGYANYQTNKFKADGGRTDATGGENFYGAAKNLGFNDAQIAGAVNNAYRGPTGISSQDVTRMGQGAVDNLYARNAPSGAYNPAYDAQARQSALASGLTGDQVDRAQQNYVSNQVGGIVNKMQPGQSYQWGGGTLAKDSTGALVYTDSTGKRSAMAMGATTDPYGQTSGAGIASWLAAQSPDARAALLASGVNPDAYKPGLLGTFGATTGTTTGGTQAVGTAGDTQGAGTTGTTATGTGLLPSLAGGATTNQAGTQGNLVQGPNGAYLAQTQGNALVSNQLQGLLDPSNPLMQRAMARANEAANARGLINSSIATQAGQTAMIDAALPIAQADAGTNQQNNMASTQALNQFGFQGQQNVFQAGQNDLNRQQTAALQTQNLGFQGAQNDLNRKSTAGLQSQSLAFQGSQNDLNRAQQTSYQNATLAYQNASLAATTQQAKDSLAQQQSQFLQNQKLLSDQLGQNAATVYSGQVASILNNKDLDADGKANALDYVNAIWTGNGIVPSQIGGNTTSSPAKTTTSTTTSSGSSTSS